MPSLAEILARAETLAQGTGLDPSQSAVIDGTMTAEAIYPHAVREAIRRALKQGAALADFTDDHLIEITDGEGALPDAVIREYLGQSAFLPDKPYASWLPYPDYARTRFDNLVCYFATRGSTLFYSCDVPPIVRRFPATAPFGSGDGVSMNVDESTFSALIAGMALTAADVGRRIQVFVGDEYDDFPVIDAMIASVTSVNEGETTGRARDAALSQSATVVIYDNSNDTLLSTVTDITMQEDTNEAGTSVAASFTAADVGRRIRITDGVTLIVDSIIDEVVDDQNVKTRANALATTLGGGTAEIYYTPLRLTAVSSPALPASPTADTGLSDKLAEDVVLLIASVLKGEMPLAALMDT